MQNLTRFHTVFSVCFLSVLFFHSLNIHSLIVGLAMNGAIFRVRIYSYFRWMLIEKEKKRKEKHTDGNEIIKSYLRKWNGVCKAQKNRKHQPTRKKTHTHTQTIFVASTQIHTHIHLLHEKKAKSNISVEFTNIFPKCIHSRLKREMRERMENSKRKNETVNESKPRIETQKFCENYEYMKIACSVVPNQW